MNFIQKHKLSFLLTVAGSLLIPALSLIYIKNKQKHKSNPMVIRKLSEKARDNDNWKYAFFTGKQEQVVFMNVSPETNPDNEVGMETHSFDQIILVVEGEAKAVLDGETSKVKSGDVVFIPEGTEHNIINLKDNDELKLISFYSNYDIEPNAVYKTKAEEEKYA